MTLWLNKNSENIIGITASEKATVTTYFFLFRFHNVETLVDTLLEIESDNPDNPRWNKFTITMPTDLDLASGFYHYYVYQCEVTGDTDWQNMVELENGKLEISAAQIADKTFNQDGQDYTFDFS
jgi:hypothetical protein